MPVSVEQFAKYCGADVVRDIDELNRALAVAADLLDGAFDFGTSAHKLVPDSIWDECLMRTGYAVFKQGGNTEGGMFNGPDGALVPGVANDPLRKAWPLIKRYTHRV